MRYRLFGFAFFLCASLLLRGQDSDERMRLAEAQHEIVMLLIEKGEFSKVLSATQVIFDLNFPAEQEHLVLVEVQMLTDALTHHKQITIAHQIVDAAFKCVTTDKSKAQLHRERGYLYKQEGKAEEALQSFEKSKEHEKK